MNTPIGARYGGNRFDLIWLPDGENIILANTFLPIDVSDREERERRRRSPATVEFNLKTKEIKKIIEHTIPDSAIQASESYAGIELTPDGELIIKRQVGSSYQSKKLFDDKFYKRHNGQWTKSPSIQNEQHGKDLNVPSQLVLSIKQYLNTPPDIFALDKNTGQEKQLTDLNPQFRELTFGRVVPFQWTDKAGDHWEAGLVYPPAYKQGQRYPLVIQTHGFRNDRFLIEGPEGFAGAYAAQALANKDIVVVQFPDHFRGVNSQEREIHRIGVEALVDTLDKVGLIDRNRVGILGFSRTGHYVQHIITFSDYDFAAATIADAFNMSFMGYIVNFGSSLGGMSSVEQMMDGAVPWGERLPDWITQSPVFHLDRVKTPLRLEQYTELINWWDVYAILRRQGKPVEWLVVPDSDHILHKPLQRLLVQQGNVDWFAFWLKDEEDSDPAKAEQYERWRKLREQQKASKAAAIAARKRDNLYYEGETLNEM